MTLILQVNWLRTDNKGKFMRPGFGDSLGVLEWIIKRCKGEAGVNETAIGGVPLPADINIKDLDIDHATLAALLDVDVEAWSTELEQIREYLQQYGDRLPAQMIAELDKVTAALSASA